MLKKDQYYIILSAFLLEVFLPFSSVMCEDVPDWRNIEQGTIIPDLSYSDQPYIVKPMTAHVCCLTTAPGMKASRDRL